MCLLVACTTPVGGGVLDGVSLTPDAEVSAVVRVAWSADVRGTAWAEYGLDGALDTESPAVAADELTLLGLKAGRDYTVVVHVRDADGAEWVSEAQTVALAAAPTELPLFTVSDVDRAAWQGPGFLLTSVISAGPSWVVVIDRDGDYVWWTPATFGPIPNAHLSPDGASVVWVDNNPGEADAAGGLRTRRLDLLDATFADGTSAHHDGIALPDGRVAWIGYETRTVTVADRAITISADVIYEAGPDGEDPVRRWSFVDDYPHELFRICKHADEEGYDEGAKDHTHGNSLMYDEAEDDFLFMAKNLDSLMRIDRATGEVVWQIGGKYGEFADVDGDVIDPDDAAEVDGPARTWWSHGHMSHWWPGGFAVFDNGYHHQPAISRATVYAYDEAARTVERTFEFPSETSVFNPLLGDVRQLDGGNVLVSWTLSGMFTEVTPAGEVVWRAQTELGASTTRVSFLESLYP